MWRLWYKFCKIMDKIEQWFHRVRCGDIICYHMRGYIKVRVESWHDGEQLIYFEGPLTELRKHKWKDRKILYYRLWVYVVSAQDDTVVVQVERNPKIYKKTESLRIPVEEKTWD